MKLLHELQPTAPTPVCHHVKHNGISPLNPKNTSSKNKITVFSSQYSLPLNPLRVVDWLSVTLTCVLFNLLLLSSCGSKETPALQLHHQLFPRPRGGLSGESQRDDVRYPLSAVGCPIPPRASLLPQHIRVQVSMK